MTGSFGAVNMTILDILAKSDLVELDDHGIWIPSRRESIKLSYPEDGNERCLSIEEGSFWFHHRNNVIATLTRMYPPNGSFVDVGGGNGFVALALRDLGLDVALVEPGPLGAMNAKNRGLDTVVCATFEQISFPSNSIAAIGLFDVLEHIEDEDAFLSNIRTVLQKNGRLFLTVPAYNALWSVDDTLAEHFRRYTTKSISRLLRNNGFFIEYATYFFSFLFVPVFLFRSIPSRIGVRKATDQQELNAIRSRSQREHWTSSSITRTVLEYAQKRELARILLQKKCLVGTSCAVVASVNQSI